MKVRVFGPNLRASGEAFHVHAEDCADTSKYGPGRLLGGDLLAAETPIEEYERVEAIARAVYECQIAESDDDDISCYVTDFKVFGCAKGVAQ